MKKETALKLVLVLVGAYHFLLGVLAFLSEEMASLIARTLFDMNLVITPQLSYISKLLGIYAIFFGLAMFIAAWNPVKYKVLIHAGIALYAIRIINRIVFGGLVQTAFGVSATMLWVEILLLAFFGVLLFVLRPKEN